MHTLTAHPLIRRGAIAIAAAVLAVFGLAPLAAIGIAGAESGSSSETVVVDGSDRYATAAQVALNFGNSGYAPTLWIANGETMADALPAGVASEPGDKILFVRSDEVPLPTSIALREIERGRIVFLGGDAAISPEVRARVESLTPNCPHAEACK